MAADSETRHKEPLRLLGCPTTSPPGCQKLQTLAAPCRPHPQRLGQGGQRELRQGVQPARQPAGQLDLGVGVRDLERVGPHDAEGVPQRGMRRGRGGIQPCNMIQGGGRDGARP